jgi:hypothetical protein
MKINEVDENWGEDEIYYSKKMAPVAKKLFASMYPDAKVKVHEDSDGYLMIETTDGEFGMGIGVTHQYGSNLVSVANAYAGKYRGIVGKLVQAAFEFLKKKHPDADDNTLSSQHDVSHGYWEKLAAKLGVGYENTEW